MSEIERYLSPHDLDDALKAMAEGDVTVVCGGTDLTPQTQAGTREYTRTLMNIRRVEGLAGIAVANGRIRIGALTTVTDLMQDEVINDCAAVLVEAGDHFASDQLRNAASLGGNVCNASPAGDMIIPLLVLDAAVELACWQDGAAQTRLVPLQEFFTAPGKTVRQPTELLTAIVFDKPADDFVARFRKSGPRPALEISTVSIGIGGNLNKGALNNVRVAMGSVAPTPIRARSVEATLEGQPLDAGLIEAAAVSAAQGCLPDRRCPRQCLVSRSPCSCIHRRGFK